MTRKEIIDALLSNEPAYEELVTRITDPEILFNIYSDTEDSNLKNRIISLLVMQAHPDLSSFLVRAFEEGDLSVKTTVIANLSSVNTEVLNSPGINSALAEALKSSDIGLLKYAIKVIKSRRLEHFESSLNSISEQNTNEYLRNLINNDR